MTERRSVYIFERPGSDFSLRRVLAALAGAARAGEPMAIQSRFVLVACAREHEITYLRAETVEDLFKGLGCVWYLLTRAGVRHMEVASFVEPESKRQIGEALDVLVAATKPLAANDSQA